MSKGRERAGLHPQFSAVKVRGVHRRGAANQRAICAKSTMTRRRWFGNVRIVALTRDYGSADRAADVRCQHCDERIGVYEALVMLSGDVARRTSRAADPRLDDAPGRVFHAACYEERIRSERTLQQ